MSASADFSMPTRAAIEASCDKVIDDFVNFKSKLGKGHGRNLQVLDETVSQIRTLRADLVKVFQDAEASAAGMTPASQLKVAVLNNKLNQHLEFYRTIVEKMADKGVRTTFGERTVHDGDETFVSSASEGAPSSRKRKLAESEKSTDAKKAKVKEEVAVSTPISQEERRAELKLNINNLNKAILEIGEVLPAEVLQMLKKPKTEREATTTQELEATLKELMTEFELLYSAAMEYITPPPLLGIDDGQRQFAGWLDSYRQYKQESSGDVQTNINQTQQAISKDKEIRREDNK